MKERLAYKTMLQFLDERYRRLPSDGLGSLMGDLQLATDGEPMDPAMGEEWDDAVEAVRRAPEVSTVEPLRKAS